MGIKTWYDKNKYRILVATCIIAALCSRFLPLEDSIKPVSANPASFSAQTNEERVSFLKTHSVECDSEAVEIVDVLIPSFFEGVFEEYENLQIKQGLSLENYKGMVLKKYTYKLKKQMAIAELVVFDEKIVACAICNLSANADFEPVIK